jgi:hypothetical protein
VTDRFSTEEWNEILEGMEWETEEELESLKDSYIEGVEEIERDEKWISDNY